MSSHKLLFLYYKNQAKRVGLVLSFHRNETCSRHDISEIRRLGMEQRSYNHYNGPVKLSEVYINVSSNV